MYFADALNGNDANDGRTPESVLQPWSKSFHWGKAMKIRWILWMK